ncbi:hypothetical protein MTR67_007156 [Solanum verrucosum]|uniref:Reverse transcriptase RNase H-like domain-containing protein n=1 Tax=Solanum verrucosum TaxID=315347 RepID=A0AAF0PZE5_SOLVR|nr:hypothetical protein MTR67_007156 [Solanum verrucosum]
MVDPQKIEVAKNWVCPSSVTEVKSFVGLANYYHRFVKNFASIAMHLTRLTQKEDKNAITYASRQLKVHERKYPMRDLELATDLNLRQRRLMKLLKYYDVTIQYHSGKAVLADALSRKTLGISEKGGVLASIKVRPTFIKEIKAEQFEDESLNELRKWHNPRVPPRCNKAYKTREVSYKPLNIS